MRQRDDLGVFDQGRGREVGDECMQLAGIQRVHDRIVVSNTAASEVDDDAAVSHERDSVAINDSPGSVQERDVDRDEIGFLEEPVQGVDLLHARRQLPGPFDGDCRVVADDFHAERQRDVRDFDTDCAQADHAQRLARQLEPDELLLARLDGLAESVAFFVETANIIARVADVSGGQQHSGDGELLDGIGIGAGRVENRHTAFAHGVDRNIVHPGPGTPDCRHTVRNIHVMHVVGAQDNGVGMSDL